MLKHMLNNQEMGTGRRSEPERREEINSRMEDSRQAKNNSRTKDGSQVTDGGQVTDDRRTETADRALRHDEMEILDSSNENNDTEQQEENSDKIQNEKEKDERIRETGQLTLEGNREEHNIHLLSIIGEIEGHENLSSNTKTTKYEHILPKLAEIEDSREVDGMLVLINTVGGDVSCGLALAEMISSLSKPTVSLVIGDSHSIGVPLAVATDYSFIVSTGTMMVHPVRMTGMIIGAIQTYDYFEMIQDRILNFVSKHSKIAYDQLKRLMLNTEMLTKDLGTVLVGAEAVKEGLIDEVGGIREALQKLNELIEEKKKL